MSLVSLAGPAPPRRAPQDHGTLELQGCWGSRWHREIGDRGTGRGQDGRGLERREDGGTLGGTGWGSRHGWIMGGTGKGMGGHYRGPGLCPPMLSPHSR